MSRERSLKLFLLLLSLVVAFAASEAFLRMLYPKSDIFPADPVKDPVLGHKILPYQSGHDAKGFRNDSAEGRFPVVCIGDSFIYGNGVQRFSAIPQQLGRMLKSPVYNMGMGGYGPLQYFALIDEARNMGARKIVIAIYMGNDLTDAFSMADQKEQWRFLRQACHEEDIPIPIQPCPYTCKVHDPTYWEPDLLTTRLKSKGSLIWNVHSYLRLHSVFYALSYEFAVKPSLQALFEKEEHKNQPGAYYSEALDVVFRPSIYLSSLDLRNDQVLCGLRITGRIIDLIASKYKDRQNFLFVIIPTKESVCYGSLKQNQLMLPPEFECGVHYERIAADWISKRLSSNGFQYVLPLSEMQKATLAGTVLFPHSSDDHPNAAGYGIIAKAIYEAVKDTVGQR